MKKKTPEEIEHSVKDFIKAYPALNFLGGDLGNGVKSRLRIFCKEHNEEWCPEYRHFMDGHVNCPRCRKEATILAKRTPDDKISKVLLRTGFFHAGTTFKRNDQLSTSIRTFVDMMCPVCTEDSAGKVKNIFTSLYSNLQRGQIPCRCAKRRVWEEDELFCILSDKCKDRGIVLKKLLGTKMSDKAIFECNIHGEIEKTIRDTLHNGTGCRKCAGLDHNVFYVHGVYDNNLIIGLKYGISKENTQSPRLYSQNRSSIYDIKPLFKIKLDNPRKLETYLKEKLPPTFTKREIPDGYTETCGAEHLDYIISLAKGGSIRR